MQLKWIPTRFTTIDLPDGTQRQVPKLDGNDLHFVAESKRDAIVLEHLMCKARVMQHLTITGARAPGLGAKLLEKRRTLELAIFAEWAVGMGWLTVPASEP